MWYAREQVANGISNYVDSEVIPRLPTHAKWIIGTSVGLAMSNISGVIDNDMVKMLGIVSADGQIEVDTLLNELKNNANKYGKLQLSFPVIGTMTFSCDDIDCIRRYIV